MQHHDAAAAQLTHKRDTLPERARVKELQAELAGLERQRVDLDTRASDLGRQQRQIDGEVEMAKSRKERDEQRMNSGAVSPKDLTGLQHELEALDRRIGSLEDDELDVMEQLEGVQTELDQVTSRIDELSASRSEAQESLELASAALDAEIAEAAKQRAQAATTVTPELLALYEKLAASYGGVGAAELKGSACQGCRLDITGTDLREVQAAAADEVVRCPECSRILVRLS